MALAVTTRSLPLSATAIRPSTRESSRRRVAAGNITIETFDSLAQCGHNDYMARNVVGARELKTRLGSYLQRVREGRTLVVTDRGEPVAELRPLPSDGSLSSVLLKLSTKGAVTLPTTNALPTFRPIRNRGTSVSDAVRDDREDRF